MRLEAKGASGWRLRRGPVASGKPQKLTRSQPDIKDDPVGVMRILLCGRGASICLNLVVLPCAGRVIHV